jgi:hypothetical protein
MLKTVEVRKKLLSGPKAREVAAEAESGTLHDPTAPPHLEAIFAGTETDYLMLKLSGRFTDGD